MYWILSTLMMGMEPHRGIQKIYVAPSEVHDPYLKPFNEYVDSVIMSSVKTSKSWITKSNLKTIVSVHDRKTISMITDSVCDYSRPLECSSENLHWVLMSDVYVQGNLININMALFDENTELLGTISFTSQSVVPCPDPSKKCKFFDPLILAQDTSEAVAIMFYTLSQ